MLQSPLSKGVALLFLVAAVGNLLIGVLRSLHGVFTFGPTMGGYIIGQTIGNTVGIFLLGLTLLSNSVLLQKVLGTWEGNPDIL
ncbi:MAG: hypothetical protein F4Z75_04125 [Synechococcus sp. SB0668_bin_15]|nr:hypothetical protein [Synechococcus sp. SB0668_bin_15]MYC49235.1 hypothetical protein [Synechococcus sp. SB0662_bin_14]